MHPSLAVLPQYLFPKQALTEFSGSLASKPMGGRTTWLIKRFIERYQVDMSEAENSDPASYATFNEFFGRALRPGARPIADTALVSPVDGAISQLGLIQGAEVFQAKGHSYSTTALLGGDAQEAARYQDGLFATLYLSPKDYHRVHMPCDGVLKRMIHVPGDLFSVNPTTARGVPGLFARNERVVCLFDSEQGPFVLVLVGATIVGSMVTVWHGVVNASRDGKIREWSYEDQNIALEKGQEMGRFLLGSTVVMLFPKESGYRFDADWQPQGLIRQGQAMGYQG
ncbi:phosphatidylserine decarboxylase [Providencia rettgeri]|uniref:Phosphatidylserine decarboxylase proenzyme n=1 Tax=Alcaligenes parafaecalis TaxID=171260 RepID=A0ABT3VRM4_9BURK|nr:MULTISPECIES: archaetidylserine decarboxylase [Alcaligenes]MBY6347948.1 phosphatidylserine decarboxylase [Providencia rettgeri]MCX5465736.1 archaetidylserine decarboxylase [Alcaligenes parafaecalis]QTB98945.1 phosphatidylserine decarboxylase [Alcaligenes sp. SORT26]